MSTSRDVSVILPTYRGAARIGRMLASLGAQTIDDERIELVIVANGPADGTGAVVADFAARHPRMRVVSEWMPEANLPKALNRGIDLATGESVTFVDDDDTVSPRYLAGLLAASGPEVIATAWIANVDRADGPHRFDNYISTGLSGVAGETVHPDEARRALQFNVCKLVSRGTLGDARFDEGLNSGVDVVFWTLLAELRRLHIRVLPVESRATYFRLTRSGSHSRPLDRDFAFGVAGKVAAIERMAPVARDRSSWMHSVARGNVNAQIDHMAAYLRNHPDDHADAVRLIEASPATDLIPWSRLNAGRARDLVISYCFPPTADTSANVAARRVLRRGVRVDVVSNRMNRVRGEDPEFARLLEPYLGTHWRLDTPATALNWVGVAPFVERGWERLAEAEAEAEWPYRSVYSRAMWPASHLLGALVKIRRPETSWTAEMSDPLGYNTTGELRVGDWERDDLARVYLDALQDRGVPLLDHDNLAQWIEHLTYALADEIVFTNANQLEFMMSRMPDRSLEAVVRGKAVVSPHPTPPESFYSLGTPAAHDDADRIGIAYFGTFYGNRGLGEVLQAIAAAPTTTRRRIRLHVFGPPNRALAEEIERLDLGDEVIAHGSLSYLDSLATARSFDVLVVNDTEASEYLGMNPYLPSKVADYLGSGRPIWAITEVGSPLSTIDTAYRSRVGDAASVQSALASIADGSKSGSRDPSPKNASNAATIRGAAFPSP